MEGHMQPETLVGRHQMLDNIDLTPGPLSFARAGLALLERSLASISLIHLRLMRMIWTELEDLNVEGMAAVSSAARVVLKLAAPECCVVEEFIERAGKGDKTSLLVRVGSGNHEAG